MANDPPRWLSMTLVASAVTVAVAVIATERRSLLGLTRRAGVRVAASPSGAAAAAPPRQFDASTTVSVPCMPAERWPGTLQ